MRDNEYTFYKRFRTRCTELYIMRVENSLDSGFPDAVMIHKGTCRLGEFKAEYAGDIFYMRNTQMGFNSRLLSHGVDVPIIIGTLDGGFWVTPFSSLLTIQAMDYKMDYKRFITRDLVNEKGSEFIPKNSDWNKIMKLVLFQST